MTVKPFFSVIVPTYARPAELQECLLGLARLDYPAERFEVVVVDDGSPEASAAIAAKVEDQLNVRLLTQEHRGPGAARNLGARHAAGRYLAFLDDDCVPDAGWLRGLEAQFALTPYALVGGRIENGLPRNPYSTTTQLITSYAYAYYDRVARAERFFTTNNFALAARLFEQMGGFDTSIPAATAEDKEFCDRWRRSGRPLIYAPGALVQHRHRLDFRSFLRQHYNYGRGILCFRILRARQTPARIRPEPFSFYFGMLTYPLWRQHGPRAWLSTALLVVAQLSTAAGALHACVKDLRQLRDARSAAATTPGKVHGFEDADRLRHHSDVSSS